MRQSTGPLSKVGFGVFDVFRLAEFCLPQQRRLYSRTSPTKDGSEKMAHVHHSSGPKTHESGVVLSKFAEETLQKVKDFV